MTKCMIYNTTGEPLDLVPALLGLCLHLRGKAVILETFPGMVVRSPRLEFPLPASVVLRKHRRVVTRDAVLTKPVDPFEFRAVVEYLGRSPVTV